MNAPVPPQSFGTDRKTVTETRPVHDARVLTRGKREAEVVLDGMRYVLRITRQGKLILTK